MIYSSRNQIFLLRCLPVLGLPVQLLVQAHATQVEKEKEEQKVVKKGWLEGN